MTNITVGIATTKRRDQLTQTLRQWEKQDRPPDRLVVCPATTDDVDYQEISTLSLPVDVVYGGRGSCIQRNTIIAHSENSDLIGFFDDDYYPARDYLRHTERVFHQEPHLAVLTNHPMLDGVRGEGVSHEQARYWSEAWYQESLDRYELEPTYGGYGCNMVVRAATVRQHGVRFDERLPGYGWLEDIDFSRQLARHGHVAVCKYLEGVHLGTKRGRQSGLRLGYSQVINPLYMVRKGTMSADYALKHVFRNLGANSLRSLRPEPWVDRRGRLLGNLLAFGHALLGQFDPGHVEHLPSTAISAQSVLQAALTRPGKPSRSTAAPTSDCGTLFSSEKPRTRPPQRAPGSRSA